MTSYSPIANSEVDPESPITSSLMARLRDNPLAIQEGDPTAPEIQTPAYANSSVTKPKLDPLLYQLTGIADNGSIHLFGQYRLSWIKFFNLGIDTTTPGSWATPFLTEIYWAIAGINQDGEATGTQRNSVIYIQDQSLTGCSVTTEIAGDQSTLVNAYAIALGV